MLTDRVPAYLFLATGSPDTMQCPAQSSDTNGSPGEQSKTGHLWVLALCVRPSCSRAGDQIPPQILVQLTLKL